MTEVSSSVKGAIIALMIVSGAINTLGFYYFTQRISSKISSWYTRAPILNTSSIPTCRPPQCSSDNF